MPAGTGVGGEHGAGTDLGHGLGEAGAGLHLASHALEAGEAGMALVEVEDRGCRGTDQCGVRLDGADAADAQHDLLEYAVLVVAAVEPVGDLAGLLVVRLDVGVQQQQRDPAHLRHPYGDRDLALPGQRDRDRQLLAVGTQDGLDGQLRGVVEPVVLLLPAAAVQRLGEVAPLVEQADGDQRHAQVRGGLQVVTGEDAETAGVDRQGRGDPELHGEVGDRGALAAALRPRGGPLEPAAGVEVGAQVADLGAHLGEEGLIAGDLGQTAGGHLREHRDGVLTAVDEGLRIEGAEQIGGLSTPGPAQVQRQLAQRREGIREVRGDRDRGERLHGPKVPEERTYLRRPCEARTAGHARLVSDPPGGWPRAGRQCTTRGAGPPRSCKNFPPGHGRLLQQIVPQALRTRSRSLRQ